MKVLGIDPGYGRVGWAVLEGDQTRQQVVDWGCVETASDAARAKRLGCVYERLEGLVREFRPDEVAVEEIYFFKNQKTVIRVGEARGVILICMEKLGLPVYDYTPLQVKLAVTGYGKADKKQVQIMVKSILQLKEVPKPDDAADAVAVALTHMFTNKELR